MNFIIIDDHDLMRRGMSKVIEEESSFRCVGTFASAEKTKAFLCEYCKDYNHESLICIVDINLEGKQDGLSLIRHIKEKYHNIYCVCYSMFKGAGIVEQAVTAGAVGYVSKNADLKVLLQAMNQADKGTFFIEESLTSNYVVYTNLFHSLTKREKEMLGLFFQKKTEEQIADIMCISERAVDNYMTRIISKLGVSGKKELIAKYGDM